MEQLLEDFLLMDDVEGGGGALDPFLLPGGRSSIDGTHDDHSIDNITSSLDDQWWISRDDDDDGFILKEIIHDGFFIQSADIPSIPSIWSTEQDESINISIDHNHQEAEAIIHDGFLIQSADIPSIPSILSTEQDESINISIDHNHQEAEAAAVELLLIDNYLMNTQEDLLEHHSSTNIDVTDDHQQQQQQQYQTNIPSIPSILSTEDEYSIIDHNHQEAAELLLIDNYIFTDTEKEHYSSTNVVTDAQQQLQTQQVHEEEEQQQHHQTHQQQHVNYELEKDEEEEEEEMVMMEQAEMGSDGSKNLFSERNRRKRLNTQFFTLRSMVPNITKMDKQSILVDALAYLQSILQQTEDEMEKINSSSTNSVQEPPHHSLLRTSSLSSSTLENIVMEAPPPPPPYERCAALPAISKIGVEKLDDERFILKIEYNKALGAMGLVQRSIEMLGMDITSTSVYEQNEHHMETMNFLRVIKKKGLQVVLTEDDLLHKIQKAAKTLGLLFVSAD